MVLTFDEVSHAGDESSDTIEVGAIFEFHYDGNGQSAFAAAAGSAHMRGTYDRKTRVLRLVGAEWIEQPANYALINFVGVVNPRASARASGTYSGTVEGSACTSFSVHSEDSIDTEARERARSGPLPPRSLPRPRP
jgi:hypothetical protein